MIEPEDIKSPQTQPGDNRVIQHSPMYLVEAKMAVNRNDNLSMHNDCNGLCNDVGEDCHGNDVSNDNADDVEDLKDLDNSSLQDMECFSEWAINSNNDEDLDNEEDDDQDEFCQMHADCDIVCETRSDGEYSHSSSCILLEPTEEERQRLTIPFPSLTTENFHPHVGITMTPLQNKATEEIDNGSIMSTVVGVPENVSSILRQRGLQAVSPKLHPQTLLENASHAF